MTLLRNEVVAEAEDLEVRSAAVDVLAAANHLETSFRAEREALADPARGRELVAELEVTKERVSRLRGDAARWMITLNDGIGDLSADADHDLRARIRTLLREAEEAVDEADPAEMWPQFERWLYARVGWEVSEAYGVVSQRTTELVDVIAKHFREALGEIELGIHVAAPIISADRLGVDVDGRVRAHEGSRQGSGCHARRVRRHLDVQHGHLDGGARDARAVHPPDRPADGAQGDA